MIMMFPVPSILHFQPGLVSKAVGFTSKVDVSSENRGRNLHDIKMLQLQGKLAAERSREAHVSIVIMTRQLPVQLPSKYPYSGRIISPHVSLKMFFFPAD